MSVTLQPVNCNNCGASLEVAPNTNFVTCGHCGSRLAVKRTGSAVFTETLQSIDRNTETMTRQLAEIAYRSELERIDREWELEQKRYLIADKNGQTHEPTTAGTVGGGIVVIIFGAVWTIMTLGMAGMATQSGGPGAFLVLPFPLIGLALVGFGVYLVVTGPSKAGQYQQARADYLRRREAVNVEQFLHRDPS